MDLVGGPPLIGFAVLRWTMDQVEAEREGKNYHVWQGVESTNSSLHLNTNQSQTPKLDLDQGQAWQQDRKIEERQGKK